ncbi:DMT family transporter [Sulfitobacter aestuariivivens]|uniref:DMT family transporter n=1 Tax=Sulfitobacter aestuariivivens TaxID=2766981 RepID=A0A927D4H0_9RHOB|nr:DMT family transporter [Sulfitobacter aestuariivivens]MBD3662671.1 DMT family transporter [Sulfitobacter aestuariivivens]
MSGRDVLFYTGILVLMGAGWGMTQPLTKIAVSTGYGHYGLVFWQLVLGATLMAAICGIRRLAVPFTAPALRLYLVIALTGTVFPNTLSYQAAVHLPAGIMSLLLSVIPMFAFAIALLMGNDRFALRRLIGLIVGLIGVLMIIAPSVDLGQPIPVFWAVIYLITALFYAFEGNYVAKFGTQGLGPFQVMLGSSLVGLAVITPFMIGAGHYIHPVWPLPQAQQALVGASVVHVLVYATYVWLVGRAGAVFTAQVSYLVTGFGLLWAWLLLSEAYAASLWLALGAMFVGMYLVQPTRSKTSTATA